MTTGLISHVSRTSSATSAPALADRVLNPRMSSASIGCEGSMVSGIRALAPKEVRYATTAPSSSASVSLSAGVPPDDDNEVEEDVAPFPFPL